MTTIYSYMYSASSIPYVKLCYWSTSASSTLTPSASSTLTPSASSTLTPSDETMSTSKLSRLQYIGLSVPHATSSLCMTVLP